MTVEELKIFAALDGMTPSTLRTFGAGLQLAAGPTKRIGDVVSSYAIDVENGGGPSELTLLILKHALRRADLEHDPGQRLAVKLANAQEPFWLAIGDALVAFAAAKAAAKAAAA